MNPSLAALGSDAIPNALVAAPARRSADRDDAPAIITDSVLQEQRYYSVLGPLKELLDDPTVLNIDVNQDGGIWIERWREQKKLAGNMPRAKRKACIEFFAGMNGTTVNRLHSRGGCDAPVYGARVQYAAPPIEDWSMCIRVPVRHVPDLHKYVEDEIMPDRYEAVFDLAIREQLAVSIAGTVNTGKTTLANAFLKRKGRYHSHFRAVLVQDRREIRLDDFPDHKVIMVRVDQAHHESNGVVVRYTYEFSDALEDALRSNGAFMVWGEVRDGYSAFALTMAMNTGAKGLITTLQASSAPGIPRRYGALIELNGKKPVKSLIANVADLLVFMDLDPTTGMRRVAQVGVLEETGDGYRTTRVENVDDLEAFMERRRAAANDDVAWGFSAA